MDNLAQVTQCPDAAQDKIVLTWLENLKPINDEEFQELQDEFLEVLEC